MYARPRRFGAITPNLGSVQRVDQESSYEDLYDWWINVMAEDFGAAEEVRHDVVHVWSVVDGKTDTRPHRLRATRELLRSVALATVNIFDDSEGTSRDPGRRRLRHSATYVQGTFPLDRRRCEVSSARLR